MRQPWKKRSELFGAGPLAPSGFVLFLKKKTMAIPKIPVFLDDRSWSCGCLGHRLFAAGGRNNGDDQDTQMNKMGRPKKEGDLRDGHHMFHVQFCSFSPVLESVFGLRFSGCL